MNKIFLSHSSNDKSFVRPIAEYFGDDRCVFDEVTFEIAAKTIKEIFKNIDDTDIFVYFISETALESSWVKAEINNAIDKLENNTHRLSQIFPIIIDSQINYNDSRIPDYLKKGYTSYNLRHIDHYKIACKKIELQLNSLNMIRDINFANKFDFFHGRDLEKKNFKDKFEERTIEGKIKHIKCLVVSGIDGLGRKAFIRGALKDSGLMERYYFPMVISLEQEESIDDLILKLSELGLGEYSISMLSTANITDKIDILAYLITKLQDYHEHVIIEDNNCILDTSCNIKYWFENALNKIKNQIAISIVSRIRLDSFKYRNNQFIYSISLDALTPADSIGFLRKYSKIEGVALEDDVIDNIACVLSGYPPQIQYCVEIAKDENKGISYLINHQDEIAEMPVENSIKLLNYVIVPENKTEYDGFLALLAQFGSTPIDIINDIIKAKPVYQEILIRLRQFSICTNVGSSDEYVKLNSVIRDYVQRTRFEMTSDIKAILNQRIGVFQNRIEDDEYTSFLSFSEFIYYIKENIKKGMKVPDRFLYSTVYVQSILELYNYKKYNKVIEIINELKQSDSFSYYEIDVKNILQFYYCMSLARQKSALFDAEVEYFTSSIDYERYNFLKGFQARILGQYARAERHYINVLNRNNGHNAARRELVQIYVVLQEFDKALSLARNNYKRAADNVHHIQGYFDCLIHVNRLDEKQKNDIQDMLATLRSMQRNKSSDTYYQIEAKNKAYFENDIDGGIAILEQGLVEFKNNFYLTKDYFDLLRKNNDVKGMEEVFKKLKEIEKVDQADHKISLIFREAYLEAFQGIPLVMIKTSINSNKNLPQSAKDKLLLNLDAIYCDQNRYATV